MADHAEQEPKSVNLPVMWATHICQRKAEMGTLNGYRKRDVGHL
jgi:hypothetical protein